MLRSDVRGPVPPLCCRAAGDGHPLHPPTPGSSPPPVFRIRIQGSSGSGLRFMAQLNPDPKHCSSQIFSLAYLCPIKTVFRIHIHWIWIRPKIWIRIQNTPESGSVTVEKICIFLSDLGLNFFSFRSFLQLLYWYFSNLNRSENKIKIDCIPEVHR